MDSDQEDEEGDDAEKEVDNSTAGTSHIINSNDGTLWSTNMQAGLFRSNIHCNATGVTPHTITPPDQQCVGLFWQTVRR